MQSNKYTVIHLLYNDKLILSILSLLKAVPLSIFYYSISDIHTMIFLGAIDVPAITLVASFGINTPYLRKVGATIVTQGHPTNKTITLEDGTTVTQYFDRKTVKGIRYNDGLDNK